VNFKLTFRYSSGTVRTEDIVSLMIIRITYILIQQKRQ